MLRDTLFLLQKRGWIKMIAFIKSFCNYRRFIADANNRQELADFIYLEMFNNKESESLPGHGGQST
jgi:hypothetical protein